MNDHAGRESACGREMGNNEFSWNGLKFNLIIYVRIKTHDGVSCGQVQPVRACDKQVCYFTGTKKMQFSCIRSSIVPYRKLTMSTVETPSGWGISCFKFELNLPSHHRVLRLQSSS